GGGHAGAHCERPAAAARPRANRRPPSLAPRLSLLTFEPRFLRSIGSGGTRTWLSQQQMWRRSSGGLGPREALPARAQLPAGPTSVMSRLGPRRVPLYRDHVGLYRDHVGYIVDPAGHIVHVGHAVRHVLERDGARRDSALGRTLQRRLPGAGKHRLA